MTFPGGALPNAQGGQPQGGQGPNFGQQQGLPQGQGYVPQQQQQQQQQFQPQQQQAYVPPMQVMPGSDQFSFPQPFFPPAQQQQQPQQQQNGLPAPQVQPHQQQQGGFAAQLGYGQPQQQQGQWQQMGQQPQQQQRPQQQQAQGQIQQDHLGRLWGPGLPPQLQGATYAQVQQALGLQGRSQQMQAPQGFQPQQVLQQPQQQQQQQAPTQQGQVGAQAQARSFWSDPEGAIERIVESRLAPMTQQSQIQAVQSARDTVAAQYPEFQQYEADVIQRMQGLDPTLLGNPQAWRIAFEQAVGERYLQQQRGGGFRQLGNGQSQQANGQAGVQGWQPYQAPNAPRLGDFFTESPSAGFSGMDGSFGQQQPQLSAAQAEVARRFGISGQQYLQGMGARY